MIARHQRIGDRDRRHRHAGEQRAHRHRGVRDRIARQDHQRRLRIHAARQQRLRDRLGALIHLAVGDEAPVAGLAAIQRRAFADEIATGMLLRAILEQMGDGAVHRTERVSLRDIHGAIGRFAGLDRRRLLRQRAERRQVGLFHLDIHRLAPLRPELHFRSVNHYISPQEPV